MLIVGVDERDKCLQTQLIQLPACPDQVGETITCMYMYMYMNMFTRIAHGTLAFPEISVILQSPLCSGRQAEGRAVR